MSQFGAIPFKVFAERGRWPLPERDRDGIPRYRARVRCSVANYRALQDAVSLVTVKRALGGFLGTAVVEAGPAAQTLTVPAARGTTHSFLALLVAVSAETSGHESDRVDATCEWIVVGDITP